MLSIKVLKIYLQYLVTVYNKYIKFNLQGHSFTLAVIVL